MTKPRTRPYLFALLLALTLLVPGCRRPDSTRVQGYLEGELIYVSSARGGALQQLHVREGDLVKHDAPLFELEQLPELASKEESEQRVSEARATVEDLAKGKRPSEIEALEADLAAARAAAKLSERTLSRSEQLVKNRVTSVSNLDEDKARHEQNLERVAALESELATAQLGARSDQLLAARAQLGAREAVRSRSEWELAEKKKLAPADGSVFDIYYRVGEWVPAGKPVLSVLPPENIKLRAYIPEKMLSSVRRGQTVRLTIDGKSETVDGKVTFISPQAEYTPPVIYSRESREKLVYLVEASFPPEVAATLHPGQPVEVDFEDVDE